MSLILSSLLLLSALTFAFSADPLNNEVLGLIAFRSSLTDTRGALTGWSAADPTPCGWAHVQCDPAGRVIGLSLADSNLSGHLTRGLSLLPRLKVLDLSNNALSGTLPEDLGSLSSLRSLELSDNLLSGTIPDALFTNCSSLRYLSLGGNRFEGPIPRSLSQCRFLLNLNLSNNRLSGALDFAGMFWSSLTRLRMLDLSNNTLSGQVAEGMGSLHNLKSVWLSSNRFDGPIPNGIGLCPHLNLVDLSGNAFLGEIPYTMQALSAVSFLSVANNELSGGVPDWIGDLVALQHLDLSGNKLTGPVPDSVGKLHELNYLSLSSNSLSGSIPESISKCTKLTEVRLSKNGLNGSVPNGLMDLGLEVLDLSANELVGSVPAVSGKISQTIRSLDLSNNKLTGTIPKDMALFVNLRYLNLSWNGLQSELPPELGSFKNLSILDLRNNKFFWGIPRDLCESGSLTVLQLDANSLSGSIPEDISKCSSLYLLSLSHNVLSGKIPVALSALSELEILKLDFNNLSGEIPQQLGMLKNLLAVNISHNRLIGRLPVGGVFQSLDASALQGNLGICSPLVSEPCKMNVPKPLVLDPNEFNNPQNGGNSANTSTPQKPKHRKFFSVSTIVAISAAFIIALGVMVVSLLNVSARRRIGLLENALESICSSSTKSSSPAVGKTVLFGPKARLRTDDLASAESLLAKAIEIGRGAFGTVYKSSIGEGRVVAIKKLSTPNIIQYHDDFDREIRVLAKARHPNLMPIKGYYWTPQLQLLITDFAPNGSLETRLHELSWASRFKIALSTAKAIAHLHQAYRPSIIHYNIKPSNILLGEEDEVRVSDFGLARLIPKLDEHVMRSRFQSAMGYIAPELSCQSLRVNEKCDVYAYGVVVLELVTGRKPVEYGEDDVVILVDAVRGMLEQGNALDCVDARMNGEYAEEEVLPLMKLGLVCTSQIPSNRPTMAEVVQILQVIKTPTIEGMMDDGY